MLSTIGDALGGWKPRASGGGDPLATIRGAWTGLVGVEVARAAQPVAIQGDTLIVITSSSSWSHQLSFLEPEIVRGIQALHEGRGIAHLRFRVGTIRGKARVGGAIAAAAARRTTAVPRLPAPRTPEEALARFRASVERSRAAHSNRGGVFCRTCGVSIDRNLLCVPCRDWARSALEAHCERMLYETPWLRPEDVLEALPDLDAAGYDTIRRRLLRAWWDEMSLARKRAALPRPIAPDRARLRKIASSYVLLETKIDPHRLEMDSPVRRNALGTLYDFIREVEAVPTA